MSCRNKPCANSYSNYGSYLRTRGCESAICRVLEDIKSGLIPIGPINPSVPCNLIISSNVTIQPCLEGLFGNGKLNVNGGNVTPCIHQPTPSIQSVEAQNYSITAGNGLYVEGPIFADATLKSCPHNTFIANTTLFTGNVDNTYPHNVTITGSSIIGSEITTDGEPILTCGDDTLFNVKFADEVGTTILNINDNFNVNFGSASPNSAGNEEPILQINENCTVYNALSRPMMGIDDGGRKIFEVICNLNADVIEDDSMMPGFVVKESNYDYTNIDYLNNANIYMHHLPKVEPSLLYPRVVVHPETGRLYKENQYFPDTYIIDTLTVREDLKVGAEFEVTPGVEDTLLVRMNNLPLNDDSTIEFLLMVNGDGTISRSLKNNIFDDIDTATIENLTVTDTATIENLTVTDTATSENLTVTHTATIENLTVTDLKVGGEFEVTPSKGDIKLLVKMEKLPEVIISTNHNLLVINSNGEVEKGSHASLFTSLLAKMDTLTARIIELEKKS